MKKLIVFLTFLSIMGFVSAQTIETDDFKKHNEVQTVMNSIKIQRISGFGGPTMSYSTLNGEFAFMMGGGGGVIINNFFFGGYGEGLSNTINLGAENSIRNFDFGHGGFWLGYEIARRSIIHPVISSKIGWGSATGYSNESGNIHDNVFVVAPAISAEVNFTRFFKINVGVEYRQTLNVKKFSNVGLSNKDFSSLGVNMNFIFGWF